MIHPKVRIQRTTFRNYRLEGIAYRGRYFTRNEECNTADSVARSVQTWSYSDRLENCRRQ
ncbi:hypothetical protein C7S13_8711 [Burkholderia cepacia]|nr:hypothetical protein [Burkholderia cepacia]